MTLNPQDTVRREVEIDTKLADLWEAAAKVEQKIDWNRQRLAHQLRIRAEYHGRSRTPYYPAWAELQTKAQEKLANENTNEWDARDIRETLGQHDTLIAQHGALRDEAAPLEAIYAKEQWSRFFLVLNNNGHIHSSMHCSTCNRSTSEPTRFSWLPELSGLTETDAVEAHGCILCSVCFPSAPVEWTSGVSKVEQAEKDARAAAKAERDAAKAAKAITDIDGSPLKDAQGYTIATLVSAKRELSSQLQNIELGYYDKDAERRAAADAYTERLALAIATKTGESAGTLLAAARAKAAKKVAAEQKKYAGRF